MSHQIAIDGDYMMLTDEDKDTCDGCYIDAYKAADAERAIDEWASRYPLDAAIAKRELRIYFGQDALFAKIAADILKIETLEERKSDRLDFHEVSVWSVKEALRRAYIAGRQEATK